MPKLLVDGGRERLALFHNIDADELYRGPAVVPGVVHDSSGNHEAFAGGALARRLASDHQLRFRPP